jgi:hypothetical protein
MTEPLAVAADGTVHLISLGAGVQSSTMALMAACGELTPMPAAAIFADTGAEPASVYRWLDWLETQLPFPLYRVAQGDLAADNLRMRVSGRSGKVYRHSLIPAFGRHRVTGEPTGLMGRKCTRDYKVTPILRKAKALARVPTRNRDRVYVTQWIGISVDEVIRMKPSREPWAVNIWPLIDKRMSRHDCLRWMEAHGYPAAAAIRLCVLSVPLRRGMAAAQARGARGVRPRRGIRATATRGRASRPGCLFVAVPTRLACPARPSGVPVGRGHPADQPLWE